MKSKVVMDDDVGKIMNQNIQNKKVCSARHSRHARPEICTFWSSLFKVSRTIRARVTGENNFSIFASLTFEFSTCECSTAIAGPSRNILVFIRCKSQHLRRSYR